MTTSIIPALWRPAEIGTLVYLRTSAQAGSQVLLIEKKRGHGAGKINAPGGKVETSETPLGCARREVAEEVGIACGRLELLATLRFHDLSNGFDMLGYAFGCCEFTGVARETAEAKPAWFDTAAVPYARMWAGDAFWLPHVLRGKRIRGDLVFDDEQLVDQRITRVP